MILANPGSLALIQPWRLAGLAQPASWSRHTCSSLACAAVRAYQQRHWLCCRTGLFSPAELAVALQDSAYKYFEVILVDPAHNGIRNVSSLPLPCVDSCMHSSGHCKPE